MNSGEACRTSAIQAPIGDRCHNTINYTFCATKKLYFYLQGAVNEI
jgi:hypothetical protein